MGSLLTTVRRILLPALIRPRSNGVPVRRRTAIDINRGNLARDRQQWVAAADAYQRALDRAPGLQHLWVQLGHMRKEAGQIDQATEAYREAARLHPADGDPLRLLGHMAKAWADPDTAVGYFIEALARDREDLDSLSELTRLLPDIHEIAPETLATISDLLGGTGMVAEHGVDAAETLGTILLDVTDLVAFVGKRRLPTGIQRLQMEVALAVSADSRDVAVTFCIYGSGRRGWIALPHTQFLRICALAKQSDDIRDPEWRAAIVTLHKSILLQKRIGLSRVARIVNIGTSWSDKNYLLDIRTARARHSIAYVAVVYDLIPLIHPEWFIESLVRDYTWSFTALLHSADGLIAISEATRQDLLTISAHSGASFAPGAVAVVPLDGDFRQPSAGQACLEQFGLAPQRYVLFVSTLEPRKNHQGAFEAWLALAETLGEAATPKLVCVGGRGWLNEHLHEMLRAHPALRRLVVILHGVPDDALAALYEHCLFTLYPSFYEGWGLPVSESLSYGKVPAISRTSSLPEAGGRFARYFDPAKPLDIAATARALIDDQQRQEAEAAITRDYVARPWRDIAGGILDQASRFPLQLYDRLPQLSTEGRWTLSRLPDADGSKDRAVEANGEPLRVGSGWQFPSSVGCAAVGNDAALRFRWSGGAGAVLRLHFAGAHADRVAVELDMLGDRRVYRPEPTTPPAIAFPLPGQACVVSIQILPSDGETVVRDMEIRRA